MKAQFLRWFSHSNHRLTRNFFGARLLTQSGSWNEFHFAHQRNLRATLGHAQASTGRFARQSLPQHFCDDENKDGTRNATAQKQINERISDGRQGKDQVNVLDHDVLLLDRN
jgi:hypothetical protein